MVLVCCKSFYRSLSYSIANDQLKKLVSNSLNFAQYIKKYNSTMTSVLLSAVQKDIADKGSYNRRLNSPKYFVLLNVRLIKPISVAGKNLAVSE